MLRRSKGVYSHACLLVYIIIIKKLKSKSFRNTCQKMAFGYLCVNKICRILLFPVKCLYMHVRVCVGERAIDKNTQSSGVFTYTYLYARPYMLFLFKMQEHHSAKKPLTFVTLRFQYFRQTTNLGHPFCLSSDYFFFFFDFYFFLRYDVRPFPSDTREKPFYLSIPYTLHNNTLICIALHANR